MRIITINKTLQFHVGNHENHGNTNIPRDNQENHEKN